MNSNSSQAWNTIWLRERSRNYPRLYAAVADKVPVGSRVFDIGCGPGVLLTLLSKDRLCLTGGCDGSSAAVIMARSAGHPVIPLRIDPSAKKSLTEGMAKFNVAVSTEFLEHLDNDSISTVLSSAIKLPLSIFSVPNNCLPPSIEPQHQQCWSEEEFGKLLRSWFSSVTIDKVFDRVPRLLATCRP